MEFVVKVCLRQAEQLDTVYLVFLEVFLHAVNRSQGNNKRETDRKGSISI